VHDHPPTDVHHPSPTDVSPLVPDPGLPAQVRVGNSPELENWRSLRTHGLRAEQAEAARKLATMTSRKRRDPGQRLGVSKPIYNSLEWLTAAELQRAYPDRGYLTQVALVSVETAAKRVPVQDLTSAVNLERRGRILDVLELRPDGTFRDLELKTASALLRAYGGRFDPARGWRFSTRGPRGGLEITEFIPSDLLTQELEKTRVVFDYAKRNSGRVRVRGVALDGVTTVELLLDPADFAGTVPARYRELPQ
jgi:hypothetical protein